MHNLDFTQNMDYEQNNTNFSLCAELEHSNKKLVQFAEEVEVKMVKREPEVVEVEIDEKKMDRLLHLLHEADPQCDTSDPQEMLDLEGKCASVSTKTKSD
jgi:hypothetical protein